MKIISTIHVKYEIESQPQLIAIFNLFEQQANVKGLQIIATKHSFNIHKMKESYVKSLLFSTNELDAVKQFIDQHEG